MNIVHPSTPQGQLDFMRETMQKTKEKFNTVQNGKGDRWRTLPSDKFRANFDDIFRKKGN